MKKIFENKKMPIIYEALDSWYNAIYPAIQKFDDLYFGIQNMKLTIYEENIPE